MSFAANTVVEAQGHPSAAEQWLPAVIVSSGAAAGPTVYFACDGPRLEHRVAPHEVREMQSRRRRKKTVAEPPGSSGSPQFQQGKGPAAKVAKAAAQQAAAAGQQLPFGQPVPNLPPPTPANPNIGKPID